MKWCGVVVALQWDEMPTALMVPTFRQGLEQTGELPLSPSRLNTLASTTFPSTLLITPGLARDRADLAEQHPLHELTGAAHRGSGKPPTGSVGRGTAGSSRMIDARPSGHRRRHWRCRPGGLPCASVHSSRHRHSGRSSSAGRPVGTTLGREPAVRDASRCRPRYRAQVWRTVCRSPVPPPRPRPHAHQSRQLPWPTSRPPSWAGF